MKANMLVLGIDPGANSGAGLLDNRGRHLLSAQCGVRDVHDRSEVVKEARDRALRDGLDLMIVREKWQAGGKRANPTTMAGLGAGWGQWKEQLLLHIPDLPSSRVFQFYPSTWRKIVLNAHAKNSEGWVAVANSYVRQRFGIETGPDEAVGICLALCGLANPNVLARAQDKPLWHAKARQNTYSIENVNALRHRIVQLETELARRALDDEEELA